MDSPYTHFEVCQPSYLGESVPHVLSYRFFLSDSNNPKENKYRTNTGRFIVPSPEVYHDSEGGLCSGVNYLYDGVFSVRD